MPTFAALYLRSSNDRHGVSIDAQRRQLTELAQSRSFTIVVEFADAVHSGKDWDRPAFTDLVRTMRNPARGWDTLLVLDTSRIGRRQYIGPAFRHEAKRMGVTVIYANVPEGDEISMALLMPIMEAMDEVHSLMCRDKGIQGQVENILAGNRGGGAAPLGYRLVRMQTDTIRRGEVVTKSRLEPDENAPIVEKFLKLRLAGVPRSKAHKQSGLPITITGAVELEWRALTYAGHTVYGMQAEHFNGGREKGQKRLPRSKWLITEDTHPALISTKDAEKLIMKLESSKAGEAIREALYAGSKYLLTGLLYAPDGMAWSGSRRARTGVCQYRLKATDSRKGRYIDCEIVDSAVLTKIRKDVTSLAFAEALLGKSGDTSPQGDSAKRLRHARRDLAALDARVAKLLTMAEALDDPGPVMRQINEIEKGRPALKLEIDEAEEQVERAKTVAEMAPDWLSQMMMAQADRAASKDRLTAKNALRAMAQRVTLDPKTLDITIHYCISGTGRMFVASPRGASSWTLSATTSASLSKK